MIIQSAQNLRIKEIIRLRDRRDRDKTGLFVIEGYREILRANNNNVVFEELFFCPQFFLGSNERNLISEIEAKGAKICECDPHVFEKISYRDRPDGLIVRAKQMKWSLSDLKKHRKNDSPFYVIAESIEKPGNLGTILRSADAAGVDGVIVCDRCTDIYNPNVVRASVGTLFTLPVVETSSEEAIQWLRNQSISLLAATPSASLEFTEVDMKQGIAIAVGTEQYGLSDTWMNQCDLQVKIPMLGVADSLNVATATTLLLYETVKQRRLSL